MQLLGVPLKRPSVGDFVSAALYAALAFGFVYWIWNRLGFTPSLTAQVLVATGLVTGSLGNSAGIQPRKHGWRAFLLLAGFEVVFYVAATLILASAHSMAARG